MRPRKSIVTAFVVIATVAAIRAQITSNPIPAPVEKRGLAVEITDLVRLPDTRPMLKPDQDVNPAGWARLSFVRDLPDGRRFANDSRGLMYLLDGKNQPSAYMSIVPMAGSCRPEIGRAHV